MLLDESCKKTKQKSERKPIKSCSSIFLRKTMRRKQMRALWTLYRQLNSIFHRFLVTEGEVYESSLNSKNAASNSIVSSFCASRINVITSQPSSTVFRLCNWAFAEHIFNKMPSDNIRGPTLLKIWLGQDWYWRETAKIPSAKEILKLASLNEELNAIESYICSFKSISLGRNELHWSRRWIGHHW